MSRAASAPHVPSIARWLLTTVLPHGHRRHWLGDLAEEFHSYVVPERGRMRARVWYWRQALGSLPAAFKRRFGSAPPMPPQGNDTQRRRAGQLEGVLMDVRCGVRALRMRPAFTIVAVVTLALGIGANVAIFSVVHATVLRALPYERPEQLVRFQPEALFSTGVSGFAVLRQNAPAGLELAAYGRSLATFTGGAEPELVRGATVSWNHFDLLGARPQHGRAFAEGEGAPGRNKVVILGHGFWRRRFGGDPAIVGQSVEIRGEPWLVVGVMPSTHQPLEPDWNFWRPLNLDPDADNGNAMAVIGRLTGDIGRQQASAFFRDTLVEHWRGQSYEASEEEQLGMVAGSLRDWILGPWQARLRLLLGAVGLVLLIACANVGNLMLARTVSRLDELGLRAALGAGRARVARLLLIEALLVAALGAGVGILAAWTLVGAVRGSIPADVPRLQHVAVDGQVLLYAVAITAMSALAFGLVPALRGALRARLPAGSGRSTGSAGESRLSKSFVAAQVAVAVILVVGAGLLLRSFWRLQSVDPGFRAEGVVALRPAPPSSVYPDEADVRAYHATITATLRDIPGVRAVGGIMFLPMHPGGWYTSYMVNDRADGSVGEGDIAGRIVTDEYFAAMEVPVLAGRVFGPEDAAGPPVVIVNEALAREAWPGEDPVGKMLQTGTEGTGVRVVGLVGDVRQQTLSVPSNPEMYVSYGQQMWRNMYFTVRVDGDAEAFLPRIRDAVRGVDARVPINNLVTMPSVVSDTAAGSRFLAAFVAGFGLVAMLLGMVGVYGVTAYAVARKKRELGIRMAMGAPRRQVMVHTFLSGARPVALGLVVGLATAVGTSRLLQGVLFEVEPLDPSTFLAVAALLVVSALLALWIPARRATLVDPATVLRDG